MIWLAKIFGAWLLAIVAVPIIGDLPLGKRGASALSWDGILGIGLVVGLPMLLFALVIALPLSLLVARNIPPLAAALLYPFLIAGAAWLISAPLPGGWKGAQQAMILFAFIMGTGWGLLNLFVPASQVTI
jgi:hypothetical protein